MALRVRKLLGTIATVVFLTIYCLIAMVIGGKYIVGFGPFIELPFFIIAGLLWIPGAMIIIKWMSKP